jgi:hypothetical protein
MSRLGVELHVPELLYVWLFLQVINSYSSWQGRHKKKSTISAFTLRSNEKDMFVGTNEGSINSCGGGQNYFWSRMTTSWPAEAYVVRRLRFP